MAYTRARMRTRMPQSTHPTHQCGNNVKIVAVLFILHYKPLYHHHMVFGHGKIQRTTNSTQV